ncbi:hypothetical protein H5410_002497 [Solanum commersonii]|uniref:Uncharacterized protein n=1 Tax=Solanum commersonii TaxID=4109 RepID=A0A9J6B2A9_SOLCO|nr:hypothetical protein H5410_002497 [Solanum commersonii]
MEWCNRNKLTLISSVIDSTRSYMMSLFPTQLVLLTNWILLGGTSYGKEVKTRRNIIEMEGATRKQEMRGLKHQRAR